jgi:hypothetical protein
VPSHAQHRTLRVLCPASGHRRSNRVTTHFLDFEIRGWNGQPSVRHLTRWVGATLQDLRADPNALPVGYLGVPEKVYSSRTIEIAFRFLPVPENYAVRHDDRIVASGASIGDFIDSAVRLRRKLDDKAGEHDYSFAQAAFPLDRLPLDAHWCEVDRSPTHLRFDWRIQPQPRSVSDRSRDQHRFGAPGNDRMRVPLRTLATSDHSTATSDDSGTQRTLGARFRPRLVPVAGGQPAAVVARCRMSVTTSVLASA